jgi:hypothetical protein
MLGLACKWIVELLIGKVGRKTDLLKEVITSALFGEVSYVIQTPGLNHSN